MTDRQRDLTWIDQRGQRARRAIQQVADEVDTGAMFDRVRDAPRRWVLPLVAVTATVAAVAIAMFVAVQPPVTVGGLDPVGGDRRAPAGLGADTSWWCPPATVALAEDAAIGNVELVSSRLSTVGEVRDWQGERIGDPTDDVPDADPGPQPWLEPLDADDPAVVCLFRGEFPAPGPGQFASFIMTPGEAPRAYQVMPGPLPAHDRHGPDGSVPLHDEPESGPTDWAPPATVVVPDVTGLTEVEARARLGDVGVAVIEFSHATDDPDEVGRVVAQSPGPGEYPARPPEGATVDQFTVVIEVGVMMGEDVSG